MMWRRKEQDLTKICKGYRITAAAEKKVMKRHRAVKWMTVRMLLKVSRIRLICTGLPKILSQVQTAAAGGGQDRVPSASGGQGSGDAKPALRITGHVSYPSPTECKFTQSYCSAHDASVYVLEDGSSILAENGKVIGINVISSEINSVRYEGKKLFVWSDQTRDFIDRLLEQGIIYSSYGNNCIVPGNTDIVSTMVREYDAIEPVSFDLYMGIIPELHRI